MDVITGIIISQLYNKYIDAKRFLNTERLYQRIFLDVKYKKSIFVEYYLAMIPV